MKLNWKFSVGGRLQTIKPSICVVGIFSGTTQCNFWLKKRVIISGKGICYDRGFFMFYVRSGCVVEDQSELLYLDMTLRAKKYDDLCLYPAYPHPVSLKDGVVFIATSIFREKTEKNF